LAHARGKIVGAQHDEDIARHDLITFLDAALHDDARDLAADLHARHADDSPRRDNRLHERLRLDAVARHGRSSPLAKQHEPCCEHGECCKSDQETVRFRRHQPCQDTLPASSAAFVTTRLSRCASGMSEQRAVMVIIARKHQAGFAMRRGAGSDIAAASCWRRSLWLVVVLSVPVPLLAQWVDYPTKDVPRTADGAPDLTAPAPRTADGKPSLTGMWVSAEL